MCVPNFLLIKSFEVLSGICDVCRYNITFLEFESNNAPFDLGRGGVIGEGSVHIDRAYFG